MSNTDADTAISALDKLIAQELAAVRAASRDGNRTLYESSSIRYHAYLTAKDEIRKALADAVAERLFGLKWALRKDSTEIIHEEWQTAPEWIRDGYLRQAIEVLATADQAQPASADGSDYEERMRVEYRDLTARAGRLRDMLRRYADGTLDFELVCPISLLSRQLDVMDAYANLLRRRARIEHVNLEKQDSATE